MADSERSPADLAGVLGATAPFRGLAAEELVLLAGAAQPLAVDEGGFLVHVGEDGRGIYYLEKGTLKLAFPSAAGNEKVLDLLTAGKTFGQAELFSGRPYPYYVQALTDVRLVLIPSGAIAQVVERDAEFARAMLLCLSRQFHSLARDIESLSTYSALQRVLRFLVNRVADTPRGEAMVELLAKKSVLASRLGITPETLSRTLHQLSARKLISVRARRLTVHDVQRLRQVFDDSLQGALLSEVG